MCSLHRGGSAALLYVEEADSFCRQRRECLLNTDEDTTHTTHTHCLCVMCLCCVCLCGVYIYTERGKGHAKARDEAKTEAKGRRATAKGKGEGELSLRPPWPQHLQTNGSSQLRRIGESECEHPTTTRRRAAIAGSVYPFWNNLSLIHI